MDANRVARDNHAFYYVAVAMSMYEKNFATAVLNSFDEPALFGVEGGSYTGYIHIDSTDIKRNCSHGSFADEIRDGIISKVAMKIPQTIAGEMNTEVTVTQGIWKFSYKITKYERGSEHVFGPIDNPLSLPDGEMLGRFVELRITLV